MNSAQTERNLQQGDVDLAECEARRRLAIDAWPRPVDPVPAPPRRR